MPRKSLNYTVRLLLSHNDWTIRYRPCEFLSLKEVVSFLSTDFFQRPYAQKCSALTAVDRVELPSG